MGLMCGLLTLAAAQVDLGLLLLCILLYWLMHSSARLRGLYYANPLERGFGPLPPASPFGFVWQVLAMSDDELEQHAAACRRTRPILGRPTGLQAGGVAEDGISLGLPWA